MSNFKIQMTNALAVNSTLLGFTVRASFPGSSEPCTEEPEGTAGHLSFGILHSFDIRVLSFNMASRFSDGVSYAEKHEK